MVETATQFLHNWRETRVYAEARAIEQLDASVVECLIDADAAGFSLDDVEKAAGGNLKEFIRKAFIETNE